MDHMGIYCERIDGPRGHEYAAMVGRFQEGFLKDRVFKGRDRLEKAFNRAVEVAEVMMPAIVARAAHRAA